MYKRQIYGYILFILQLVDLFKCTLLYHKGKRHCITRTAYLTFLPLFIFLRAGQLKDSLFSVVLILSVAFKY